MSKRLLEAIKVGLFLSLLLLGQASALSQAQRNALSSGVDYFNVDADTNTCDGTSDGTADAADGKETAKWQTTLTAPYSLEDFVVEVLRDIAAKEGVPETDTVTQQHTLALVAFAWGEGGNLTNDDIYNPWNTGYSGPDLQPAGGHSTSGVQSYSSFNDGVEATARVMTGTGGSGGYQSRLGTILKDPASNAQQVMQTLTYYQKYKNNKAWAAASMPPNQESYYKQRLNLVSQTQSNYKHEASELIGPPGNSDSKNLHSTHPLRYTFTGDSSSSAGGSGGTSDVSSCTAGGVVAGSIIQTALNLAYTDPPENTDANLKTPKPSYKAAVAQYNSTMGDYTDCGGFVATVMRASGVDPNYPPIGSGTQLGYVKQHPDKYQIIGTAGQWTSADVQPGDIAITDGHTYIYVGKQPNGLSDVEASQTDHVPELDRAGAYNSQNIGSGPEEFTLVRVKS